MSDLIKGLSPKTGEMLKQSLEKAPPVKKIKKTFIKSKSKTKVRV